MSLDLPSLGPCGPLYGCDPHVDRMELEYYLWQKQRHLHYLWACRVNYRALYFLHYYWYVDDLLRAELPPGPRGVIGEFPDFRT